MKKQTFIFLAFVSLLLCGMHTSKAQVISSAPYFSASYLNQPFDLVVSLTYNKNLYKDYKVVVSLETGVGTTSPVQIVSDGNVASATLQAGSGANSYFFILDNAKLENSQNDRGISVTLRSFINQLTPSCTIDQKKNIVFSLYATSVSGSATPVLLGTYTTEMRLDKQSNPFVIYSLGLSLDYQASQAYPLEFNINPTSSNAILPVTLQIEYPTADFDVLAIRKFDDYNFDDNQNTPITFSSPIPSITPSRSTYSMIEISSYDLTRLKVYFKPKGNSDNLNKNIYARVKKSGLPCGQINLDFEQPVVVNQPIYQVSTLFPFFDSNLSAFSSCNKRCDFSYASQEFTFYFELNNSYSSSASLGKSIKLTLPHDIVIKNLVPQNGFNGSTSYTKSGGGGGSLTLVGGAYNFGTNGENIQYITIENANLQALTGLDFTIKFTGTNVAYAADNFKLEYVNSVSPEVSKSLPVNLGPLFTNCASGNYVRDWYYVNSTWTDRKIFSDGEKNYVLVSLQPNESRVSGIYNFDNIKYKLNNNMTFVNSAIKVLKAGTGVDFNKLENYVAFSKTAQIPSYIKGLSASNVKIVDNGIEINGLSINYTLNSTDCKDLVIYLLAEVAVKSKTPSCGLCYRSTLSVPSGTSSYLSPWDVNGSQINLLPTINLSCSGQDYAGGNIKKGESFSLKYIAENNAADALSNFYFALSPLTFTVGGTKTTVNYSGNITAYTLDPVTGQKKNVTLSTPSPSLSLDPVDNLSYYIVQTSDFSLKGFDKLYLEVPYSITSPSISLGATSDNAFFKVKAVKGIINTTFPTSKNLTVTISNNSVCSYDNSNCSECITSFSPLPNHRYLLSAWVKEDFSVKVPDTYKNAGIKITYNNGTVGAQNDPFWAKGPIVDGWQRIESSFLVPNGASNIQIELVNLSTANEVYFDDIRIHPFKSNMKSFVYDPSSQRLTAELDENNYATFYEYDDEGILVRVKKETERGVMTIKESRNNQSKIKTTTNP